MANATGKGGFGERPETAGRPKGTSFADFIRKVGSEDQEGLSKTELAVRNAFNVAMNPDHPRFMEAIKWLADRADGAVAKQIDVTTKGESLNESAITHEERVGRLLAILASADPSRDRPSTDSE